MMNKNMMKQAQQLQKQMMKLQEEIEASTVEHSTGGGAVKVIVTEETEMLEDLIQSAINGAIEKAQELASSKMGALTGGLNLPGLM